MTFTPTPTVAGAFGSGPSYASGPVYSQPASSWSGGSFDLSDVIGGAQSVAGIVFPFVQEENRRSLLNREIRYRENVALAGLGATTGDARPLYPQGAGATLPRYGNAPILGNLGPYLPLLVGGALLLVVLRK